MAPGLLLRRHSPGDRRQRGQVRPASGVAARMRPQPRAIPMIDMQSGRFAVTSKSITASRPAVVPTSSIPSTAKPRTDIVRAMASAESCTATNSRSHDSRTFTAETAPETQVVLVEQTNVIDPVAEHRHVPFRGRTRSGYLLGVVAHRFEHSGMHHAAPQNLEPARVLACHSRSRCSSDT